MKQLLKFVALVNSQRVKESAELPNPAGSLTFNINISGAKRPARSWTPRMMIEHRLLGIPQEGTLQDITRSGVTARQLRAVFTTRFDLNPLSAKSKMEDQIGVRPAICDSVTPSLRISECKHPLKF